jgi:hypothetical protein
MATNIFGKSTTFGKSTKRQQLQDAIANSQKIQEYGMNTQNFGGGYAGALGLLAQGLTTGVGAYQEYKQKQELAKLDAENNEKFINFANTYGDKDLASFSDQLSDETKQAYIMSKVAPNFLNKMSGNQIPASVQEYEYVKNLPQSAQAQYMNIKRNTAGEGAFIDASGNVATLPNYGKASAQKKGMEQTARNESDLVYKPEIAKETTKQEAIGKKEGAEAIKYISAPEITQLTDEIRKELPKATSGLAQKVVSGTASIFGISTEMDKADRKLEVLGGRLISYVPRFEGPQSDKDVLLYQQMAGDVANKEILFESRLAALDVIDELNIKYSQKKAPTQAPTQAPTKTFKQAPQQKSIQKSTIIKRYNPQTGRIE